MDTQEKIAKLEAQISMLLELLEEARRSQRPSAPAPASSSDALRMLLGLTLKQRAVLFATLAGHSYSDIASVMGVDDTTVKLHLKAALGKLGFSGRPEMLSHSSEILAAIKEQDQGVFGLPLDWMDRPAEYARALAPTRTQVAPKRGGSRS